MTHEEFIALAREAGFGASNPFAPVIVRHANGSWVSITPQLERLVALVEQQVLLRQAIASTTVVVCPEQQAGRAARLVAFVKELDSMVQPRTTRYWPGFKDAAAAGEPPHSDRLEPGEPTPEPLRLADLLEKIDGWHYPMGTPQQLRRLHEQNSDLLAVTKGFRRKLATYVSVYPGDKELRRLLAECDAAIANAEGGGT